MIGSNENKQEYVASKVEKWVDDVTELADIAREEPQAALSAYTKTSATDGHLYSAQCPTPKTFLYH